MKTDNSQHTGHSLLRAGLDCQRTICDANRKAALASLHRTAEVCRYYAAPESALAIKSDEAQAAYIFFQQACELCSALGMDVETELAYRKFFL